MATPRTRNLRLFLSSGLTTEARANLEIIDRLGDITYVDSTDSIHIRSKTDIFLSPADPNTGGIGQGDVQVGRPDRKTRNFLVYSDNFVMNGTLRILDIGTGGTKHLILRYNSTLPAAPGGGATAVDNAADRTLSIDLQGGDRQLSLEGDLLIGGPNAIKLNSNASQASNVVLPVTGTLATLIQPEVFENKTIDADVNNIQNIADSDIKEGAAIAYSKLNLANSIVDTDVSPAAAIEASKIRIAPGIDGLAAVNVQAGFDELQGEILAQVGAFDLHKVANTGVHGVTGQIVGTGNVQTLTNKTLTSPQINSPTGIVKADVGLANVDNTSDADKFNTYDSRSSTLTNKLIDGGENTLRNIPYAAVLLTNKIKDSDISATAEIAYSKLNLADAVRNTDISDLPAHRIEGRKVSPNFEDQSVSTELSVKIGGTNQIELAPPVGGFDSSYTLNLPPSQAAAENLVLAADGSGGLKWYATVGVGTVTDVAMTVPSSLLALSGSPITTSGTFAVSLQNQAANTVFAGPSFGGSVSPTFRALVPDDVPVARDIRDFAEDVQDAVAGLVQNSSSVLWTYNDEGTPPTLSAAVSLASFNTGNLTEGVNKYFTAERVYAANKTGIVATAPITIAQDDLNGTLTLALTQSGISTDSITEGTTNLFFTDERAQDAVGNLIIDSNDIGKTYNDEANSFTLNLLASAITAKTSVSPEEADQLLVADVSDASALKNVTARSISDLGSYAEDWDTADGAGPFTITHNLNSLDVLVEIYDKTDGETVWISTIKRDTVNTVQLTASVAPPVAGWRVLIRRV